MRRKLLRLLPLPAVLAAALALGAATVASASAPPSLTPDGPAVDSEREFDFESGLLLDSAALGLLQDLLDSGILPPETAEVIQTVVDHFTQVLAERFSCEKFAESDFGEDHPDLVTLCETLEEDGWTDEEIEQFKTAVAETRALEFCADFAESETGQANPDLVTLCQTLADDGMTKEEKSEFKAAVRAVVGDDDDEELSCEEFAESRLAQDHPELVELCEEYEADGWTDEEKDAFKAEVRRVRAEDKALAYCDKLAERLGEDHELVALCLELAEDGLTKEEMRQLKAETHPGRGVRWTICERLANSEYGEANPDLVERCEEMLEEGKNPGEILKEMRRSDEQRGHGHWLGVRGRGRFNGGGDD